MPKRKRSVNETIHNKLEKHRIDIFRAISSAKAAERKRFGSRLREPGITDQKKARLEQEYHVLKTLDLRQVARSHLHANLLRIKAVEASDRLPAELREGVPKSTLSPEEITIHNNVVSVLCNTVTAKQALDRAVADICETLGVPVAEKSKNVKRRNKKDTQDHVSDRIASPASDGEEASNEEVKAAKAVPKAEDLEGESDEGSEFQGFSEDEGDSQPEGESHEPLDEALEEGTISKYDNLLGGSSDEEDEFDEEFLAKYRGKEQVNLDDISLSGSASEIDDFDGLSDLDSESESASKPPPKKTKHKTSTSADHVQNTSKTEKVEEKESKKSAKAKSATKAAVKATKSGNSAFLPTLMGGYISGSESASDIDAPPKKNRKGQRARQQKWEKKYGAKANHLQKSAEQGGRDAGWDMKRGAVDSGDRANGRWGKGGRSLPMRDNRKPHERDIKENTRPNPKPAKKDNEGPLHPSWEARKKAKDAEKTATFAGSKIVFD